jgi:type IV pilus assembly protein PilW
MTPLIHLRKQRGLTLIELMIALVLGLILVAGIIQVFVSNKQTYRVTEAHSLLQDNARFALELLSRDVRSAGYSGCRAIENLNVITIADTPIIAMTAENIITGSEGKTSASWSPSINANFGTVLEGTDVITIQRAESCGGNLISNVSATDAAIEAYSPNACSINTGDVLMLSDCQDAHIFRATSVTAGANKETIGHNTDNNQASHFCTSYSSLPSASDCDSGQDKIYSFDAELTRFRSYSYFLRENTQNNPTLYRFDNSLAAGANNPAQLIEGIEDMQIMYGIDDNNDDILDRTENAETIDLAGEWNLVISAEINLLVQTLEDNLTTTPQTISFNGQTVSGADGRIRRIFSSAIGIRNRIQ